MIYKNRTSIHLVDTRSNQSILVPKDLALAAPTRLRIISTYQSEFLAKLES